MCSADVTRAKIVRQAEVLAELFGQLYGVKRDLDVDVTQVDLLSRLYLDGGEGST